MFCRPPPGVYSATAHTPQRDWASGGSSDPRCQVNGSNWQFVGHRRLGKGILNNPMYVGRVLWNRSQWMRHPVTKHYTYRVRPADE